MTNVVEVVHEQKKKPWDMLEKDYGVEVVVCYFAFMLIIIVIFAYCCSSDLMMQVSYRNRNTRKRLIFLKPCFRIVEDGDFQKPWFKFDKVLKFNSSF